MKLKTILIFLIIILILLIGAIFIYFIFQSNNNKNPCIKLGCNENTIYVGSINSNKYYTCDCHYANRIKSKNIICFKSDKEAVEKGYSKVNC